MKISSKITKLYQEGGAVDPAAEAQTAAPVEPAGAPADPAAEDPLMQIAQLAMQGLETNDCEAMAAACEGLLGLLQGGAPAEEAAPAPEPVFKKGGKIVKRV